MSDKSRRIRISKKTDANSSNDIHSIGFEIGVSRIKLPIHEIGLHVHMPHEHQKLPSGMFLLRREDSAGSKKIIVFGPRREDTRADWTVRIAKVTPKQHHFGPDLRRVINFELLLPCHCRIVIHQKKNPPPRDHFWLGHSESLPSTVTKRATSFSA